MATAGQQPTKQEAKFKLPLQEHVDIVPSEESELAVEENANIMSLEELEIERCGIYT